MYDVWCPQQNGWKCKVRTFKLNIDQGLCEKRQPLLIIPSRRSSQYSATLRNRSFQSTTSEELVSMVVLRYHHGNQCAALMTGTENLDVVRL